MGSVGVGVQALQGDGLDLLAADAACVAGCAGAPAHAGACRKRTANAATIGSTSFLMLAPRAEGALPGRQFSHCGAGGTRDVTTVTQRSSSDPSWHPRWNNS